MKTFYMIIVITSLIILAGDCSDLNWFLTSKTIATLFLCYGAAGLRIIYSSKKEHQ